MRSAIPASYPCSPDAEPMTVVQRHPLPLGVSPLTVAGTLAEAKLPSDPSRRRTAISRVPRPIPDQCLDSVSALSSRLPAEMPTVAPVQSMRLASTGIERSAPLRLADCRMRFAVQLNVRVHIYGVNFTEFRSRVLLFPPCRSRCGPQSGTVARTAVPPDRHECSRPRSAFRQRSCT
jgi:hypothetical protein